jgi:hypothetical protein
MQVIYKEYSSPNNVAKYRSLHRGLERWFGPAYLYLCDGCCGSRAQDWANVHGTNRYVTLCHACHMQYDFSICPKGHDTNHWGRTKTRGCNVCSRLANAEYHNRDVCEQCGYATCKCPVDPAANGAPGTDKRPQGFPDDMTKE